MFKIEDVTNSLDIKFVLNSIILQLIVILSNLM